MRNRLPRVDVPVMHWMIGKNADGIVVSFELIVDTDIMRPLEEILSLSLENLSSIETNR